MRWCAVAAFCMLLASSAHAEGAEPPADADPDAGSDDDDLSDLSLEQLLEVNVVTASNMSESQSRAPGVVIRLTRDDLEARGYHELLDLFDDLPGMDIVRPWGDDYLKVYWRGYRTDVNFPFLLLLDGQVTNSLWSGDASAAAAIPMSEIDHVEIVYGPVSAVYGANAFMGVVNVITIAGAGKGGTQAHVRVSAGSYHGSRLDRRILDGVIVEDKGDIKLSIAGRIGLNWTDAGAAERFEYTQSAYANDPALWGGYLGFQNLARGASSPIDEYGLDARLVMGNLELGAYELSLATGYGYEYPTDQAQPYAIWHQRERSVYAAHKDELEQGVTSRTMLRWRDSGIPNDSYYLSGFEAGGQRVVEASYWQAHNRSTALTEDVDVEKWDWLALAAGASYEHRDLANAYDINAGPDLPPSMVTQDVHLPSPVPNDLSSIERPQRDVYGAYAQARARRAHVFGEHDTHALHLGVRYDWDSLFGAGQSPSIRIGYVGELETCRGLVLAKLLYGTGWQEPNPRQLYGGWLGSGSNPTLRPEHSRTFELDLSHTTENLLNLVSAWYAQDYDTIVQFAGGASNKGKRDVIGVDYQFRALWRPKHVDSLSVWGYYSYLWSRELVFDASGGSTYKPIGDLATHKLWLGATAKIDKRITATLRSRAYSDRNTVATNPLGTINGAWIFDGHVQIDHVGTHALSLALTIDNLLGTAYSDPGIRTADSGDEPGHWNGQAWVGSAGFYNSRLPQPGRLIMVTVGLDL
ncbi:MAG TPA: TonB-dependent receptor [Kofleriaceae bacterium]|nr:TonB-dependent receptor [Kofleriaceae bacterium]